MKLKNKFIGLESGGKNIIVLNVEDAEDLNVVSQGRVKIVFHGQELIAIVNTAKKLIKRGSIGVYKEVIDKLNLRKGEEVEVQIASFPSSVYHIRNKLRGKKLTYEEIFDIINDMVKGRISEIEIASYTTALHIYGLDLDEATSLSLAMVETGNVFKTDRHPIVDKHSIGGVPGDKTTLIAIPIIAASGLTIPKTSSRAITSAAGTADRAEVLMPVKLDLESMQKVVKKIGGCIVWGGALDLAPADDIFIRVEHPLSIDPLLLPSIMSKKKAVGAELLVIDIPCGRGTKVKTIGEANLLAKDFIEIGRRLNINVQCIVTYGEEPIGHTVGPSLEAKEALKTIMRIKDVPDLVDKATDIAGMIINMSGVKNGKKTALKLLNTGKAEKILRAIIEAQGGNPEIKPEDIKIGDKTFTLKSKNKGFLLWLDNNSVVELARLAGAPKDKGAGTYIYKKIGDAVQVNDPLITIYSESNVKLQQALNYLEENRILRVNKKREMTIQEIKERPLAKKPSILER